MMVVPALPGGVDVASYQGDPDWDAVAGAGFAFAFTKATESTDYTNPTLYRNWTEIRRVGMYRGAYHYARPEYGTEPTAEADYFLAAITRAGGLQTGDLLALDLEPTVHVPGLATWVLEWLRHVEARVGFKPLVYTGAWVVQQQGLGSVAELAEYGLWLAAYQPQMPPAPAPWPFVAFWQHSSTGRVPGISWNVDLNVFNGSADRIPLYGKPDDVDPEPEPPTDTRIPRAREKLVEAIEILDEPAP